MYISLRYLLLLLAVLIVYYALPREKRWISLFSGSIVFYCISDIFGLPLLLFSAVISYIGSIVIEKQIENGAVLKRRRQVLAFFIILSLLPLFLTRIFTWFSGRISYDGKLFSLIIPLGISFYSLQIVSYLCDVHNGKTHANKDFIKYLLFITFFPQIVQGPIPRYDLMDELYEGHLFSEKNIVRGFQLILWGFFLKFVIADRAGIFVDHVFMEYENYAGLYVLMAGVLYSVQLYTDFSSCVCIAKGSAEMFGISLNDNFKRPYFAVSVKDFWRRWHITLSGFLRDYVYIPLGGNRKGRNRKYINTMITFLVSGIWHGTGLHFVFWGFMHGVYQIIGDIIKPVKSRVISTVITFFFIMTAWIVFRAESLSKGLKMVISIFVNINPGAVSAGSFILESFTLTDWIILISAVILLIIVSLVQERGVEIRDHILLRPAPVRGALYFACIIITILLGEYGEGFDAGSFIYAGF